VIEAVLYDLDGLMVDSEALHGQASEQALNKYGHRLEDLSWEMRKNFYGKRVVDVAGEIVDSLGLPASPEQWAQERLEIFMGLIEKGLSLMPGVEQSLEFFDRRGIRKAVVSSGNRKYVERMLEMTGVGPAFNLVITGDEVSHGKPDPQCFLIGARKLGVQPANSLVLEDAYAGICAAKSAGMKVIGIRNEYNDDYHGADLVLGSLAEIDDRVLRRLENSADSAGRSSNNH
jgi:HAD superfamily hydrolase (TIGR01509 family)